MLELLIAVYLGFFTYEMNTMPDEPLTPMHKPLVYEQLPDGRLVPYGSATGYYMMED